MSGWDIGLHYWLKNMSLLEAAVLGGVISGIIILLFQRQFGQILHDAKKDAEENKRLLAVAKGDWPEHIRQAARNKLRKKKLKGIKKAVLSFLLFIGIVLPIYLMHSGWLDNYDEETRQARLEQIEFIDDFKRHLKLRTIRTTISGDEATRTDELMIERWESMCSMRAQNEGNYKRRWDGDKISIIRNSYQACMLEQGWKTELCEDNEKECVQLPFHESICTVRIREWLEDPSAVHESFFRDCAIEVK